MSALYLMPALVLPQLSVPHVAGSSKFAKSLLSSTYDLTRCKTASQHGEKWETTAKVCHWSNNEPLEIPYVWSSNANRVISGSLQCPFSTGRGLETCPQWGFTDTKNFHTGYFHLALNWQPIYLYTGLSWWRVVFLRLKSLGYQHLS